MSRWHSAYFAAALDHDGGFKAGSATVEIECGLAVFDAFYCWLHTGERDANDSAEPTVRNTYLRPGIMCKGWVFADFCGIPAFANCVIVSLHDFCVAAWQTPGTGIHYVYEDTAADSRLRMFIKDWYSMSKALETLQDEDQSRHIVAFLHGIDTMDGAWYRR